MPESVHDALDANNLSPEADHNRGTGLQRMLLAPADFAASVLETPLVTPYLDRYLCRLLATALFAMLWPEEMKDKVWLSFVAEKGKDKSRLVIDTRNSNRHFAEPPGVSLTSVEGLSGLEFVVPGDVAEDPARLESCLASVEL